MSAATHPGRLSPTEVYQIKWLLGAILALMSLATLLFLPSMQGSLMLWGAILAIALTLGLPRLHAKVSPAVWKGVTPALIVFIIADFVFNSPDIIAPLLRMIILLLLVRCLQDRRKREDMQLVLLSMFAIVMFGVLTMQLEFLFVILAFSPVAMGYLFLITVATCNRQKGEVPEHAWTTFHWPDLARRVRTVVDLRMLGFSGLLFIGTAAMTSLIFILMPRFRLDQAIPFLNMEVSQRSGFSDEISYTSVNNIKEDNSIAFRVDLDGEDERPNNPYWRMLALDEYYLNKRGESAFRLSSGAHGRDTYSGSEFSNRDFFARDILPHRGKSWTFYLEGGVTDHLPMLGVFTNLRFESKQDVHFLRPVRAAKLREVSSQTLFFRMENMGPMERFPASHEDRQLRDLIGKPIWTDIRREGSSAERVLIPYPETTLIVPEGEANREILTRAVTGITNGQEMTAEEFSVAAMNYLHRKHDYSLDSNIPRGEADLLLRWMDSDEPGHCELFAGSFALLARAAGFPARVTIGYQGGTWNSYESYLAVRNSSAHAWTEIYTDGYWLRIDPTPGASEAVGGTEVAAGTGLVEDSTWRAYLDSLRILWYRRIVDFDQDAQEDLAGGLKERATGLIDSLKETIQASIESFIAWIRQPWDVKKLMILVYYAVIILAIYYVARYGKVLFRRLIGGDTESEIAYQASLTRRRAGRLLKRFNDADPTFVEDLAEDDPHRGQAVSRTEWRKHIHQLQFLRFGPISGAEETRELLKAAKRLLTQV